MQVAWLGTTRPTCQPKDNDDQRAVHQHCRRPPERPARTPGRHCLRRRLQPGTVAARGLAGGRPPHEGGRRQPGHAGRLLLEPARNRRRRLRLRLAGRGDGPDARQRHRRGPGHPGRRPAGLADRPAPGHPAGPGGRHHVRLRLPPALRRLPPRLPREVPGHGREDGGALRQAPRPLHVAREQRIRPRLLRPARGPCLPRMAAAEVQQPGRTQPGLEHRRLGPGLLGLGPGQRPRPAPHLVQPVPPPGLPPVHLGHACWSTTRPNGTSCAGTPRTCRSSPTSCASTKTTTTGPGPRRRTPPRWTSTRTPAKPTPTWPPPSTSTSCARCGRASRGWSWSRPPPRSASGPSTSPSSPARCGWAPTRRSPRARTPSSSSSGARPRAAPSATTPAWSTTPGPTPASSAKSASWARNSRASAASPAPAPPPRWPWSSTGTAGGPWSWATRRART